MAPRSGTTSRSSQSRFGARSLPLLVSLVLAWGLAAGCSSDEEEPDLSGAVYDPNHVLMVEVEMPAADWDALRQQTRENVLGMLSGDCLATPFESPFTWFQAKVTIDGETFENVDIRKKGFIGSLNTTKPSLKLDLGEYDKTQKFNSVRHLTLNNSVGDPALVRQCLAYDAFRAAGMASSRCNYAKVFVNGESQGIFVNVEPVKKAFLKRNFEDHKGNLYEGTLSDFRAGWEGTLEKKNNEEENDFSDVAGLVNALETDDAGLIGAVESVLDLDAYLSYWVTEVLLVHWDGHAGNRNNFYIYNNPTTGRFEFIPWGTDLTLTTGTGLRSELPESVYATSLLPRRLYLHPEGQARYSERLQQLLTTHWSEESILGEIDRMEALLLPLLDAGDDVEVSAAMEVVRQVVSGRRQAIANEIASAPYQWDIELDTSACLSEVGAAQANFEAEWGSSGGIDPFNKGSLSLNLELNGETVVLEDVGAVTGIGDDGPEVLLVGRYNNIPTFLYFSMQEEQVVPGEIEFDLLGDNRAFLLNYDVAAGGLVVLGLAGGTMTLTEASTVDGAPVVGAVDVTLYAGL